jgi:CHAD domain-containing protein
MTADSVRPPVEEEIKLLAEGPVGPEAVAEAVRRAGFEVAPIERREQLDVYVDTERADLLRRGVGLRVRYLEGERRLTWKADGASEGATIRRPEIELRWPRKRTPESAQRLPEEIRHEVEPVTYGRGFCEKLRVANDRSRFLITDPGTGAHAELVVDMVRPSDGERELDPFVELEIETLEGPAAPWPGLAEHLGRGFALSASAVSKLERSLRSAGVERPPLPRPEPLTRKTPLQRAALLCFLRHFRRLQANEPGTRRGDDVEALHDMRVSSRRLRSAFKRFGPAFRPGTLDRFTRLMRTTGQTLGPARDLDVFLESLEELQRGLPATLIEDLEPFKASLRRERERERQRYVAWLGSPRRLDAYAKFESFVEKGLAPSRRVPELPVGHVAPLMILRRARKVFERGRAIDDGSPPEQLHRLRIEMKHLRYAMEDFSDLYGKKIKEFIKASKNLQNVLGAYNDVEVQLQALETWTEKLGGELPSRSLMAVGSLVGVLVSRRQQTRAHFSEAWSDFDRGKVRDALTAAVVPKL